MHSQIARCCWVLGMVMLLVALNIAALSMLEGQELAAHFQSAQGIAQKALISLQEALIQFVD